MLFQILQGFYTIYSFKLLPPYVQGGELELPPPSYVGGGKEGFIGRIERAKSPKNLSVKNLKRVLKNEKSFLQINFQKLMFMDHR